MPFDNNPFTTKEVKVRKLLALAQHKLMPKFARRSGYVNTITIALNRRSIIHRLNKLEDGGSDCFRLAIMLESHPLP